MWQSRLSGDIFVIDGAHRLSALIAWVHDDYGDRKISLPFFGDISKEQKAVAEEARKLIGSVVGSYTEIKYSTNPSSEHKLFAGALATGGITLQWVRGDAASAERSFHTINTEQTPIGDLEVRLIRDRRCPNTIAARALVQVGTGQYYYSSFPRDNQEEIKKIAHSIYDDLFVPPLETPIKTLDLPVAGRGYSSDSLSLVLDVVEFVNPRPAATDTPSAKARRVKRKDADILSPTLEVDQDGSATITFLRNLRKASSRIAGLSPQSLGLHPAVYFYSATGNYQPAALLATISFVQDMEKNGELPVFTKHREVFEDMLLKYKYFINQIVRHYGSGHRGLTALTRLYRYLLDGVINGKTETEIVPVLIEDDRLAFLKPIVDGDKGTKVDFTSERKSAVYLRQAIQGAIRCGLCGARLHIRSIAIDHIDRKKDGGVASEDNGQAVHPYCNSLKS